MIWKPKLLSSTTTSLPCETFYLQEDPLGPRTVRATRIREEEAAGNEEEHDEKGGAQTGQDPLSAAHQVDEVELEEKTRRSESSETRHSRSPATTQQVHSQRRRRGRWLSR